MKMGWTEERQAACTNGIVICAEVGCTRVVYYDKHCSDHWEGPRKRERCRHWRHAIIVCGCCKRVLCEACYGAWNALACERCRANAG